MSASYEDLDPASERRRDELEIRRRKHLIFGGASAFLLLLVVVGAVATVYTADEAEDSSSSSGQPTLHTGAKSIQMLCSSTDYQKSCENSLSKALPNDNPEPKDVLKAAISVAFDEISKGFNKSQLIKTKDERVKGAVDDCRELFDDSRDELESSLKSIVDHGLDHITRQSSDLRNWLSAVMSYQRTCIDGFPEGELRDKLEKTMVASRELTSNALAIVGQVSDFLSMLNVQGFKRRLLEEEDGDGDGDGDESPIGPDGFPSWMPEGERRLLKESKKIKLKHNVTVSKDGKGDFKTISEALAAMPKKYQGRYVIYVKKGVYEETVNLTKKMQNVTMYGEGAKKTIVTGSKNYVDGTRTFQTATFVASGDNFMAMNMGFRNTAGAMKHQAVALRVQSDRSIFFRCRMEGYQDTLYAQTHRQYYRSCIVSGTIDFVFGDAAAVFQNSLFVVRRPLDNQRNIVTAQGRVDRHETTGFVVHRCRIVPDLHLKPVAAEFETYLARPWKEYSRTVFMQSEIGGLVHPAGYLPWEGDFALRTLYYGEYDNVGAGANLTSRVDWPGVRAIKDSQAQRFTVASFIQGGDWIARSGVPVRMGLY